MTPIVIQNRLSEIDWASLPAGSVVTLPYRPEPYRERIVITNNVTLSGVPGPNGEFPEISGVDATTDPQFAVSYAPIESSGLITLWHTLKSGGSAMPTDVVIENLLIRDCYQDYNYTGADGVQRRWGKAASGIYALNYNGLTVRNCQITNCGNGILSGDSNPTANYLQDGCKIWGNGVPGSDTQHGTYVQANGSTYRNNWYGHNRAGSLGGSLKDRSANALIENNVITANARCVDLSGMVAGLLPLDAGAIVRNNLLLSVGPSRSFVYREPSRGPKTSILGNTMVYRGAAGALYYVVPLSAAYDAAAVFDVQGNLIDIGSASIVRLNAAAGVWNWGPNIVRGSVDWTDYTGGLATLTGKENVTVVPTSTVSGFVDEANGNYNLTPGAAATGFGWGAIAPATPIVAANPPASPLPPPPPPPVVPPVVPPPPPTPTWVEIARNQGDPQATLLAPGLRKTTTTLEVFEQEK